jgi:uncharacterized protein (TIGR02145 family)
MKTIKNLSLLFCAFFALVSTSCDPAVKTDDLPDDGVVGSVKDVDGNVYKTITIGTQTWMAENLKTTKYRDGISIANVLDGNLWADLSTGAYCNENNDAANGTKYGNLYNWYAVNTGKLAPAGWHVPSDAEWTTLENYVSAKLGTSGSVAKALATTVDWAASTNAGAVGNDLTKNNSIGFSALPGGTRLNDGAFVGLGRGGYWWSLSENSTSKAWYRNMLDYASSVLRGNVYKEHGFSVRCVKD